MTPMSKHRRTTRWIMPVWTGESMFLSELLSWSQSSAAVNATVRVIVRAQPLSVQLSELLSELSCCQSCCQSWCQSSATFRATVRVVVRAQPLSEQLSELSHSGLLSELLSEQLSELSCCQNIRMKLIFTHRLVELIDNQKCHSEIFEKSMAALGITMETRTLKPLLKLMQLQPHQISAVNWMVQYISKWYFSHWKPPEVSERMWSVNLNASISGGYHTLEGYFCRPSE